MTDVSQPAAAISMIRSPSGRLGPLRRRSSFIASAWLVGIALLALISLAGGVSLAVSSGSPIIALILVAVTDGAARERIARRGADVARAAAAIGLPVAGILSGAYDEALPPELTPAGRIG